MKCYTVAFLNLKVANPLRVAKLFTGGREVVYKNMYP